MFIILLTLKLRVAVKGALMVNLLTRIIFVSVLDLDITAGRTFYGILWYFTDVMCTVWDMLCTKMIWEDLQGYVPI